MFFVLICNRRVWRLLKNRAGLSISVTNEGDIKVTPCHTAADQIQPSMVPDWLLSDVGAKQAGVGAGYQRTEVEKKRERWLQG